MVAGQLRGPPNLVIGKPEQCFKTHGAPLNLIQLWKNYTLIQF